MAVAFGSDSQAVTTATATSFTVAAPTGTALNDVLVAFCVTDGTDPSEITLTGGTTWNELTSGDTATADYKVFWKVAGSSEPANYTVGKDSTATGHASIIRATGALRTAPPVFATSTSANGATISTPSITPAGTADLLIRFVCGSADGLFSGITFTPPASHTERTDIQAGAFVAGSSATRILPNGSATGTASFTASNSSLVNNRGITVGLTIDSFPQTVTPSAITSGEAFGTARLNFTIIGQGLASAEAFGNTQVSTPQPQTIIGQGIISGEAFGNLTTRLYLGPSGIASAEAFGTARLAALISPTGIPSSEAFGLTNVAIEQFIDPSGIPSEESFGLLTLQLGYPQTVEVEGIPSLEYVSDLLTVRNRQALIFSPPSIQETPAGKNILHIRYGVHRGITVIKRQDSTIYQTRYPALTDLEVALKYWMGGYKHVLTVDEANELTAAGYGANITLEEV